MIVVDPSLFADAGGSSLEDVLVSEVQEREAAAAALERAGDRMMMVNELGFEYGRDKPEDLKLPDGVDESDLYLLTTAQM